MTRCQTCGKELNEAEAKMNYCDACGKPAGVQPPRPAAVQAAPKPQPKPAVAGPAPGDPSKDGARCPKCNFVNPKDAKACGECGAPLADRGIKPEEKKVCPSCGRGVKETWRTCPRCGKPLAGEEPKKEAPAEPKKCPGCAAEVEPDWLSCPFCGKPLAAKDEQKAAPANNCPKCGKAVKKEWAVCPYCQARLGREDEEKPIKVKLIFPDKSERELPDGELAIGREDFEECQRKGIITKSQLGYITRRSGPHFKVLRKDGKYYIAESGANGTWLDGNRLEKGKEQELNDNSEIVLADEKETAILVKIGQ